MIASGMLGIGILERHLHDRVLAQIPLRIHVNGTRGKTSVTRQIATVLRISGRSTVAKCTGTAPLLITPSGTTHPWPRRGRARIQEQMAVMRYAARVRAEACVIECMALDPRYQWVSEHRIVQSHIGVITNVRRDHFEEMGATLDEIARSLANTIPQGGHLVTGDERYVGLFERVARDRGTTVHVALPRPETAVTPWSQNWAITRKVAEIAGVAPTCVEQAMLELPETDWLSTPLPSPAAGSHLIHLWSMNDPDSFVAFLDRHFVEETIIPLYNHRRDRPLRAKLFGEVFKARESQFPYVLVTGDPGVERLFVGAGIPKARIKRTAFPLNLDSLSHAVASLVGSPSAILGCGNAQGMAQWELPEVVSAKQ